MGRRVAHRQQAVSVRDWNPGATGRRLDVNWSTEHFKVISRSFQGQFKVPAGWVQGGYSGTSPGDRYGSQAKTRQAWRLRAGVEVRAPTMATDHAASVVAGARNHRCQRCLAQRST